MSEGQKKKCPYYYWNIAAAVVHLANFAGTFFLSFPEFPDLGGRVWFILTDDYLKWLGDEPGEICPGNNTFAKNCSEYFRPIINIGNQTVQRQEGRLVLELEWLIIAFHFLSFLFQISVCRSKKRYEMSVEQQGMNYLRFVEYSISASLMMVCIAIISGISDIYAVVGIFFLTSVTMGFGLICEYLLSIYTDSKDIKFKKDIWRLAVCSHLTGWVSMLAAYGQVFATFATSLDRSNVPAPWFVYVIVIGLFLLFNIFGFIQLWQVCFKLKCCCYNPKRWCYRIKCLLCKAEQLTAKEKDERCNILIESWYVANSLVSKTLLGWLIYFNLLRR